MEPTVHASGRSRRIWGLTLLALVIFAAATLAIYSLYASGSGTTSPGGPGLMHATCSSLSTNPGVTVERTASGGNASHVYFLVVAADPPSPYAGFNGSYYAGTTEQWPIMHVLVNQTVSIHVINCASSEAHGFQVTSYDDKSVVAIQPGQSYDVTFLANKEGTFRVYCDIFCAIHPFMQNGALVVS